MAGLIPAHAGKTPPRGPTASSMRAHPRSRGENSRPATLPSTQSGSSPLTRGKRSQLIRALQARGLIPAHAGKTDWTLNHVVAQPAHPRSRGENLYMDKADMFAPGSSPLTRGKLRLRLRLTNLLGLIPAHAGKTAKPRERPGSQRAHPRSRGENIFVQHFVLAMNGSSPLTRGKQRRISRFSIEQGLIPAHAGKTI